MPSEIIRPTISLDHPPCRFLHTEIPPGNEGKTITTFNKMNWLNKTVSKIENMNSIGARFAKGLARICLIISLIGIPIIFLWNRQVKILKKDLILIDKTQASVNIVVQQWNKRAEIVKNCGIPNFETLPILDLGVRRASTDEIDFIKPEELTASIMKGVDILKRPFISLKIKRKDDNEVFVSTIFQRYMNDTQWVATSKTLAELSHKKSFTPLEMEGRISAKEEEIWAQIINGEHPIFTLAS
jgi:hypothetical protein